jgi:CRP-like cAMP-binding protein
MNNSNNYNSERNNADLITQLLQHRDIAESDRVVIRNAFQRKHFKTGEWLLLAGKVTRQLFFINKGVLKVTIMYSEEKQEVYFFPREGHFVTFLYSMYGNVPSKHGVQAACNTEVMTITEAELDELYKKLPYLRTILDKILILFMAEICTIKNVYVPGEALDSYKLFLKKEPEVAHRVALTDVASYLGITPQSLSRIRRAYAVSPEY